MAVPLGVLDLVPIASGSNAGEALRNSIDLAHRCEEMGYARYWFAEHHLNPGVAGTSPAVVIALAAGATTRIRLGSGAVQLGHRTPLSTVEEFGLLDAAFPGRIDLGLGRSGGRPPGSAPASVPSGTGPVDGRTPNGLVVPARPSLERLASSPRLRLQQSLLQQPGAQVPDYAVQVDDVLALLAGSYHAPEGARAIVVPGEGAGVQLWILGSSGGTSASVAGQRGLRFAANYHVNPATILEAVDGYRAAFRPGELARPYVSVSADVVVAADDGKARTLASGYPPWVLSIRRGAGAIDYPSPQEAAARPISEEDNELIADRLATQFVGSPGRVADQLEILREAAGADELVVTTITHDHEDRVRSFELLAEEWRNH